MPTTTGKIYLGNILVSNGGGTPTPAPWVRNPSWPPCEANVGDNKITGLYAVWPEGGNFFAMTNSGAYTIDFGDGTTTNYASGSTANYEYDYNNANLANTDGPVTFTASTNTVNRTAHGYSNGNIVQFYNIVTTTGIDEGQEYYVTNATANTFQISRKGYNSQSVSLQELTPEDVFFKPDGTKMYILGSTGDDVNEYDLSTPWDVSTASFLQLFSVAAQETVPTGIFFKPDGTKMYILGSTGDDVNEYDLSTAWNVSTASFLQLFSVAAQETVPTGIFFKPDGTKMYIVGSTGDDVNEYDLSTAWNVSTASFLQNFGVSDTVPTGIFFKPDGTKMYIVGSTGDDVNEYDLSTAWNVSTASFLQNFGVSDTVPTGIFFKPDGTIMFIVGHTNDSVEGYTLSTPWDISTAASELESTIVSFTNDGSATLLPYKIATVTITPQDANDLTSVNFSVSHNQVGLVAGYSIGWLDIAIAAPSCTVLQVGSTTTNVRQSYLERVRLNQLGNITSCFGLFANARVLQSFVIPPTTTANVTNMQQMFQNCSSLQNVPFFDTSNVTTTSTMFSGCSSLTSVPLFNTARVIIMSGMFSGCSSLTTAPLFDTVSVTNMSQMFASCVSLTTVPLMNTADVTNMQQMFAGCTILQSVPVFNTSSLINVIIMFSGCLNLKTVPLFDTSRVTSTQQMFQNCISLTTVPLFNTAAALNMSNMFSGCVGLTSVPPLNVTAVNNSVGFLNSFTGCSSLAGIQAKDFRFSFSVASCKLSATALNEIYTNLPTVVGQTITVTGNYGTANDVPTIATAKGWTVTG